MLETRARTVRSWFVQPHVRITCIYVVMGCAWIYFSDRLIGITFQSPEAITAAQNVKGWFFISITAAMLYLLVLQNVRTQQAKHRELIESYDQTIEGWMEVMDVRHQETRRHTDRVTRLTAAFAREAGVDDAEDLVRIRRGATLHDVGKIGIPDEILLKPGPLDNEEWRMMKEHPVIAAEILNRIHHLRSCVEIPYCHHEKWDGSGYPQGLRGEQIPLAARLFAIIDVWDALIHTRVYKPAWPEADVLAHIRDQAGIHFDPQLAELFIRRYDAIKSKAGVSGPRTGTRGSGSLIPAQEFPDQGSLRNPSAARRRRWN